MIHHVILCYWLLALGIMLSSIIHVIACISISFLFMPKYSIIWIYHILFIHLLVGGHVGLLTCFHFLTIINNAAMDIGIQIFENLFSVLLVYTYEGKVLGHMLTLCLIFWVIITHRYDIIFSEIFDPAYIFL